MAALAGMSVSVSAAPSRTLEEMFKLLDTNDDSRLTRAEFVGKAKGEDAEKAKARFAKLDSDSSGMLTFQEFDRVPRKNP
ncbi:MAG TPA: EF-hand domain-containing protein [Pirellulales bacterium]|nr:EF-hand domain-containing protein [Pirellulales bacterium]